MSPELISILVLGLIFVIATLLPVNIGVLAFAGAFLVGTLVADQSTDDIIAGFPATCSSPWSGSPTCSRWRRTTAPSTG
jgi:hypothetical protein